MTAERFEAFPRSVQAALLRVGRRIGEGFEGVVEVQVHRGGVGSLRWIRVHLEQGDVIEQELFLNGHERSEVPR